MSRGDDCSRIAVRIDVIMQIMSAVMIIMVSAPWWPIMLHGLDQALIASMMTAPRFSWVALPLDGVPAGCPGYPRVMLPLAEVHDLGYAFLRGCGWLGEPRSPSWSECDALWASG